jgi:polysaccharide pyruvyl transferase WcaK-like protein
LYHQCQCTRTVNRQPSTIINIEDIKIIRLHHETLTKLTPLIYRRPNTFVSLNPYSYLNIIKNASLVIATRVHACVIALAYQQSTMLLANTKRSYLFDRLGLGDIIHKPVNLK